MMPVTLLALVAFVCLAPTAVSATAPEYKTSGGPRDDILNVHLVCHTHDDVGWLKTVDEYYYGANNTIQHAAVQFILDSVLLSLQENPDRKFIYVEIAFFWRWWEEQDLETQAAWKALVDNGQVEFINGGWCMNDEATTHYNAIIDQMTLGHTFLLETFGVKPTIGWHIDPFGHSATMPILFAEMGFNAFYFGRVDYQDRADRFADKELQFVWRSSQSQQEAVEIYSGITYYGYNPPQGYCFDWFCDDPPMEDDPYLEDYNVESRVNGFVEACQTQAEVFNTNNIMLTMGSDFQYENANEWYKNLDKLIHYTNLDGRVNVFYSTPSIYTEACHAANLTWTVKTDDFFPYADNPYSFWTGYYTSRPALKAYVRENNARLQTCKQLEAFTNPPMWYPPPNAYTPSSVLLRRAMGVAQHHDAVSGTERQPVADDYALRLAAGTVVCDELINNVLSNFTGLGGSDPTLTQCQLLNVSVCNATSNPAQDFTVVLYNPLARERTEWIRLPVGSESVSVYNGSGDAVDSQTVPVSEATIIVRDGRGDAPYELVFQADVKALSTATYFVQYSSSLEAGTAKKSAVWRPAPEANTEITNGNITLTFDSNGLLSTIDAGNGVKESIAHTFMWYNASAGNNVNSTQTSGAYIFRPNSSEPFYVSGTKNEANITVIQGSLVTEVWQTFSYWTSNVFRLYAGETWTEAEFTVGPIPFEGMIGHEVISKYTSAMETDAQWWTDANGREMQHRVRNYQPDYWVNLTVPISVNYYPVNTAIYIKDNSSDTQFTILNDRSQGGSSVDDGDVELMVHRRLMYDDYRGVGEPLNETGRTGLGLVTRGKHRLLLTDISSSGQQHRSNAEKIAYPLTQSFAPLTTSVSKWLNNHRPTYQLSKQPLPDNVHLLTWELQKGWALLRLAHLYAVGEDPVLSQPATVDLKQLFTTVEILDVEELNLSANQPKHDLNNRLHFRSGGIEASEGGKHSSTTPYSSQYTSSSSSSDTTVTLGPMQIKTYNCTIQYTG